MIGAIAPEKWWQWPVQMWKSRQHQLNQKRRLAEVNVLQVPTRIGIDMVDLFVQGGGRKIDAWTAQHKTVVVPFDQPGDDPKAFFNANTLAELQALENR